MVCPHKSRVQGDLLCDLSSHCGFKIKKAKGIVKAKRVFDCVPHAVDLQRAFGIDITNDLQMSPPNAFCRPCYQSMEHAVKAIEANLVSRCMVKVYDWSKHAANNCKVNIVTPSPCSQTLYTYAYIYSYAGVHIIQIMLLSRYPAKQSMDIARTKNLIQHIEQIAPTKTHLFQRTSSSICQPSPFFC